MQYVSHEKASRDDVKELKGALFQQMEIRKARKTDICSVREELHRQAFDELIRQVTLDSEERGIYICI